MVDFPSAVAVPPTSAYGPGQVDFSWLGNLLNKYQQGKTDQFTNQQRDLTTQQQQAFKNGLPVDANGNPDYRAITQMLAQKGDIQAISQLAPYVQVQNSGQVNPLTAQLLGMPAQGGAQPQPQAQPAPQKTPATYQGGDASGSIVDVVSAKLSPDQAGPVIARIAQTTGLDPNAPLTQGQTVRVNGLVTRYSGAAAPSTQSTSAPAGGASAPSNSATSRVNSGFAALPPSAANVSPAAQPRPAQAPQQQQRPQQAPQAAPVVPQSQQAQPQPAQAAPQQQSAQQRLTRQVPLPPGFRPGQEEQAIQALENAAAAERNPRYSARLTQWANDIAESIKPQEVRPGTTIVNPRDASVLYQTAPANPAALAMQRFIEENPNATPEQIQAFNQAGRAGRSAIAMYMNRFIAENPNATADEIKRAAQLYTTQTTAQNRFLSGPQGNTIRSLNVVVSHLQTMQDLGDALKNGNVKAFNAVAQRWSEETGDPAPTNFDTAKQIVGAEVIKALGVAGAGSQAERQEAADAFNRARSPAQLAGAIDAARKLLVGQLGGLRRQYIAATGLPGDSFDQMLEPQTQAFFGKENAAASPQSGASAQPAPPSGFTLVK